MNYYVVGYLPRASDHARPDLRTGRIVLGHTERATAERLAAWLGRTTRFGTLFAALFEVRHGALYVVRTPGELRGHLRRAAGERGEG